MSPALPLLVLSSQPVATSYIVSAEIDVSHGCVFAYVCACVYVCNINMYKQAWMQTYTRRTLCQIFRLGTRFR